MLLWSVSRFAHKLMTHQRQSLSFHGKVDLSEKKGKKKLCLIRTRAILLSFGTLLLTLEVYKVINLWRMSSGFKGLDPVRALIQDEVLYYSL